MDLIAALIFMLAEELPPCEHEDASTQSVCVWDGGANGTGDVLVYVGPVVLTLPR